MIVHCVGNMFYKSANIRVNAVNCVGVMGAGIALQFRLKYPEMFIAYQTACRAGQVKPGVLCVWKNDEVIIVNFPTKRHWRDDSRYEDIGLGLIALHKYLDGSDTNAIVTVPPLGCGLGGLDWSIVCPMIVKQLESLPQEINLYHPK